MKKFETYIVNTHGLEAEINIIEKEDFVPFYEVTLPKVGPATANVLNEIKAELIKESTIRMKEVLDPRIFQRMQEEFNQKAKEKINQYFPEMKEKQKKMLAGLIVNEMFGLGEIEVPLADEELEEIVINGSKQPVWVYHKRYGWLKTNIFLPSEESILDYSNLIGRRVGRQITILNPLMDAHLLTGDRVNATLFPISTEGNTITIRKFARKPWTITDFIKLNTLNEEVAALVWLCIQYELNVIITGGTGSGKTSALNTVLPFIQSSHRIISIEDTRELSLPKFQHWVPLTTREPNPEGKGEVSMLDLMVNALRMRPDRIVVGEIRRQREAEVLFEAMHTGHSVYSTVHADSAEQMKRRLITPPINVPESLLESLHLILVQYRHRRIGIRRTIEVAEVMPVGETKGETGVDIRTLYRWKPREDRIVKEKPSMRLFSEIGLMTGMTQRELTEDLEEKKKILHWMVDNGINDVHEVGKIVASYYKNKNEIIGLVEKGKKYKSD